jgi:hypothetical protein
VAVPPSATYPSSVPREDEYVDGGFASEFDDEEFDDEPRVPSNMQPAQEIPLAAQSGRHRKRRRGADEAADEVAEVATAAAAVVAPAPAPAPAPVAEAKPKPSKAKPERPKAKQPRDEDDDDFDDEDDDDDFDDEDEDDDFDDEDPAGASSSSLDTSVTAPKPQQPRKLPWIAIAAASTGLVVLLAFVFRDALFGGSDDAGEDTGEVVADAADAGQAPPEAEQPQPDAQPDAEQPKPDAEQPKPEAPPPAIPPEELEAKLAEATSLVNKQKFDDARVIIDEVLGKIPKEGRALALLAQTQLEKGQLDEALAGANNCVDADASQAFCWIIIATVEQNNDNLPRALEAYRKYLEIEPDGRHAKSAKKQVARLESKVEG